MKPLYNQNEFNNAKGFDLLPLECYYCSKSFYKNKKYIKDILNPRHKSVGHFCSRDCTNLASTTKKSVICIQCNSEFYKFPSQIKKSKNHFCSQSCAGTYNTLHKSTGTRRSKLEVWLEVQLPILYPNIEIHFNRKDAIGSELDIYIPSLNLAFELNGIFHYEPIYGDNKLQKIKNNDSNKFQACINHNISLCIIDTSSQKYFKESTSKEFLDIIIKIISDVSGR